MELKKSLLSIQEQHTGTIPPPSVLRDIKNTKTWRFWSSRQEHIQVVPPGLTFSDLSPTWFLLSVHEYNSIRVNSGSGMHAESLYDDLAPCHSFLSIRHRDFKDIWVKVRVLLILKCWFISVQYFWLPCHIYTTILSYFCQHRLILQILSYKFQ